MVTYLLVAKLFAEAYKKTITVATAEHGFRLTGLFPLNRNISEDYKFAVVESIETSQQKINK